MLLNCVSFVLLTICVTGPVAFLLTRAYLVHTTYNELIDERERDGWLMEQCTSDAFYHNMKHHSDLCDEISTRHRDSLLLKSVSMVIENTFSQGLGSVLNTVRGIVEWSLGRGFVASCMIMGFLLFAPSLLVPIFRRQLNRMADERLRHLHYGPYGSNHYIDSASQRHIAPWNDKDLHTF